MEDRLWHKSYVPGVAKTLEYEKITVSGFLSRSAKRFPGHVALNYMGARINYKELDGLVNRFARALVDLGVSEGDKVALILPNIPQAVIAYLAVFGTVLGFVWFYEGVRALGATRAGIFINVVPISAVILAYLLLHEPVTWSLAAGAVLVLSGVYLGAFVFHVEPADRWPWFLATLLSGLLIVCLDLYESGAFLLQLRGLVVAVKIILLALVPTFGAAGVWVLAVVAFASVISSHAPSSFRYYLVWGRGRIKGAETKG